MELLLPLACVAGGILVLYATLILFIISDSENNARFFINVPQERGMAITKGGGHYKFLYRGNGKSVDPATGKFIVNKTISLESRIEKYLFWGRTYKGFYKITEIKEYRLQWQEWTQNTTTKKQGLVVRDTLSPYVLCMPFPYAFFMTAVDDKNNLSIDIAFTLYLQPTGLYTAFYSVNWFQQMTQKVLARARSSVGQATFEKLRGESDTQDGAFKTSMQSLSNELKSLVEHKIVGVAVDAVSIAGAMSEEITRMLALNKLHALEAKALVTLARGKKKARKLEADGEIYYTEGIYTAKTASPDGKFISAAESMKELKGTLVIGGDILKNIPLTNNQKQDSHEQ